MQYKILDINDAKESFEKDLDFLLANYPNVIKKSKAALFNFYLARKALMQIGHSEANLPLSFKSTIVVNHHYLANHPKFNCSISHTDGCGAAIISDFTNHRSVGIDIERANREIPANSQKYFRTEADSSNWSDLELWILKEACFKCVQPLWKRLKLKQNIVLNNISVEHEHFYLYNKLGEEISGHFEIKKINHNGNDYILAVAYLLAVSQTCV